MYLPRAFAETDRARLRALCDENLFATVVGVHPGPGDLEIAHLPCLIDGKVDRVCLHVARGNPLAQLAGAGARLTAVFHGPHCYVTPRWYREPDRQVPTWNYAVVHASGPSRVLDADALRALVGELAARFEADAERPWRVEDASPTVFDGLLGGIVGIAIDVDRLEGKYKLSQNRNADDRAGVRAGLGERRGPGDLAILELMHEL